MNRNITIDGLASRTREDGTVGSVLTVSAGDGCVNADMAEGLGTVRVSHGQTIVRVSFGENGIAGVAVDDDVVWGED